MSGSGKTTIGRLLAEKLRIAFFDADDYHPPSNIKKMQGGIPLTDEDRLGWLQRLNQLIKTEAANGSIVLACSALKETYRTELMKGVVSPALWFLMRGDYTVIHERISQRKNHFMPSRLLASQFETLEIPSYALSLDVQLSPSEILDLILQHIKEMSSSIGVIGMGVMGRSLARNFGRNGVNLSLYNQRVEKKEEHVANRVIGEYPELQHAKGFEDLKTFVASLPTPKIIVCMIPAGDPIDQLVEDIKPFLQVGDILIDGGNSHYRDTERRQRHLESMGVQFIGSGISGGEEGALNGPSIMMGGAFDSFSRVQYLFELISAKDKKNKPCCAWVGNGGAGHFVKMVHNGIEYAEMQMLAEVYGILRWSKGMSPDEIATVLADWATTEADSYLMSISAKVLRKKEGEGWLIDSILDKAENKGTGGWATIAAAELGVPIPTIAESLFARYSSSFKQFRLETEKGIHLATTKINFSTNELLHAYQLARISNHQQGFHLIESASNQFNWQVDLSSLARIWTNGCIIRSILMEQLEISFKTYSHVLLDAAIQKEIESGMKDALTVIGESIKSNVPIPAIGSAIIYLQTMTKGSSYANVIQAQRDYFGAHGYERSDHPGRKIHTNWK